MADEDKKFAKQILGKTVVSKTGKNLLFKYLLKEKT